jgi:hypothetical protein
MQRGRPAIELRTLLTERNESLRQASCISKPTSRAHARHLEERELSAAAACGGAGVGEVSGCAAKSATRSTALRAKGSSA